MAITIDRYGQFSALSLIFTSVRYGAGSCRHLVGSTVDELMGEGYPISSTLPIRLTIETLLKAHYTSDQITEDRKRNKDHVRRIKHELEARIHPFNR